MSILSKNVVLLLSSTFDILFDIYNINLYSSVHGMPDPADYIITSTSLPENSNNNLILSNSFIGHRLHGDAVYMNGLYNGYSTHCHRARIPCPVPYVHLEGGLFTLNCYTGSYTVSNEDFTQSFYMHSVLNRVIVTEVTVRSPVTLVSHAGTPSRDLQVLQRGSVSLSSSELREVVHFSAQIKEPETKTSPRLQVHYISTTFPESLVPGSYVFISSFGYTEVEAAKFYNLAVKYYSYNCLFETHRRSWEYVWSVANVDVEEGEDLAITLKTALFYLLSAFPHFALHIPAVECFPFQFYGVSPGSLGNGGDGEDYWGHVFWDQDLWMLPGVMVMFPELAKHSILYRIAMLPGARSKARSSGYLGAMYPWESGRTGVEVCPGAIYAEHQQHITGCVVYAIRQYVRVTGSWDIVSSGGGWELLRETAQFWVSRVEWNGREECYEIKDVMDPDEYHSRVNNSCFTNSVAKLNLEFAVAASKQLGLAPDPRWEAVADNIKIPYDEELRYHPEYDGYEQGTLIKQASVVLLGYPLDVPMCPGVRGHDIEVYEKCTDAGPGMTYSMYCIGMLELGQVGTAGDMFKVQFRNLRSPWHIWNEYPGVPGCANFLTAVGGFIQSVLYGYLGVRVREEGLHFNPRLLPNTSRAEYTGVYYRQGRFRFSLHTGHFTVTLDSVTSSEVGFLLSDSHDKSWGVELGAPITLNYNHIYKISRS